MSNTTSFVPAAPTIPGAVSDIRRPRIKFPAGACDCHAHVFGPQQQYPLAPGGRYVPPEASIEDFVRMLRTIGCERAVIVHPSIYGTDNSCTVDALRSGKFQFRGVAVIDEKTTDSQLEDLHQAGMRGIRLNLNFNAKDAIVAFGAAPRLAERVKSRGWHFQFLLDINAMPPDIDRQLMNLPVDIVIDHFGFIKTADGLQAPGFQRLLKLARHERSWFKLTAAYRLSVQPPMFPDVTPFARALFEAASERCVWGTDWPHPSAPFVPNPGDLADMLLDWIPDEAQRNKVLVANPARLYDF